MQKPNQNNQRLLFYRINFTTCKFGYCKYFRTGNFFTESNFLTCFLASDPIEIEEEVSVAKPVEVVEILPSGSDFDCPGVGTHPSPLDCVTYYQCTSEGLAYESRCPPGLHFNRENLVCDWPDNVECNLPNIQRNFLPYNLPQTYRSSQSKQY